MHVLIVNTTERTGGAAIAATRLTKALRQEGTTVVTATRKGKWAFYWERLRIFLANRMSKHNLWQVDIACPPPFEGMPGLFKHLDEDITRRPEFPQADVIHLHWVNQGFLSLHHIERILQSGKRIIWTLHDQWPYAGICHYTEDCDRYQTHCHDCPLLARPGSDDLSYKVFEQKRRIYHGADITFVGCSQWIADLARKSPLTEGHRVVSIPNTIDHTIFRPVPKREARRLFGLPIDKPIVLFICQKVSDERKGVRYLEQAMEALPDVRVIRVGQGGDYEIRDERRMALLYAAADVFVTPSLQDNLPNTIVEAMSCGTPCVGFHVGGIPEMIHHQRDGYVARYRDADDLARGIRYVLAHPELSTAAAQYARETYDEHRVAQLYMAEYSKS